MKQTAPKQTPPQRQAGIALISVLFITVVVALLIGTYSIVVVSEMKSTRSAVSLTNNAQAADAISERARLAVITTYLSSNYTASNFLLRLREQVKGGSTTFASLKGSQSATVGDATGQWEVRNVSAAGDVYPWVEVAATAHDANGTQTVIRRVSFGKNNVFDLAMLSETTNCMYCHLRVKGDVGNLDFFRPGWGSEKESGKNSGAGDGGSIVYGNAYSAKDVSKDNTNLTPDWRGDRRVNGAIFKKEVFVNYDNEDRKLPVDAQGNPAFPPIERDVAKANALGSVRVAGGVMYGFNSDGRPSFVPSVNGTYEGNLVLSGGTKENPIVLNKDVYVTGDVVIKGYVTGQGAIYAGRNMYMAGDVITVNPPYKPGEDKCASITDPDACARLSIADNRDAFRAAARGNIVIGDYTEYDGEGKPLPWDRRQSADFYRDQFGFKGDDKRYFEKGTGDELKKKGERYFNAENKEVSGSRVKEVGAKDAYDYAMKPGTVTENGSFKPWTSDATYRSFLGEQSYTFNTWRTNVKRDDYSQKDIEQKLIEARIPPKAAAAIAEKLKKGENGQRIEFNEATRVDCSGNSAGRGNGNGNNCTEGDKIKGTAYIQTDWDNKAKKFSDSSSVRVIIDNNQVWETPVTRVDAYLYANQRIAGKTSMQALAVNGGLVAREIGVLAPGRRTSTWWTGDGHKKSDGTRGNEYKDLLNANNACGPNSGYAVPDTEDCAFTINYDHRMRNGGYGFNLVQGTIGMTLSWELADKTNQQVKP